MPFLSYVVINFLLETSHLGDFYPKATLLELQIKVFCENSRCSFRTQYSSLWEDKQGMILCSVEVAIGGEFLPCIHITIVVL